MFAVPGWSVSADALKPQIVPKTPKASKKSEAEKADTADQISKKRKRGHGSGKGVEVTKENLGDLWRKYIEEKSVGLSNEGNEIVAAEKPKKKRRKEKEAVPGENAIVNENEGPGSSRGDGEVKVHDAKESIKKIEETKAARGEDVDETAQANENGHDSNVRFSSTENQAPKNEGKAKFEQRKAEATRKREQKTLLQAEGTLPPPRPEPSTNTSTQITTPTPPKASKKSKKPKEVLPAKTSVPETKPTTPSAPKEPPPATSPPPPAHPPKLTELQQRMAAKLTSARFRHLNQTLYTTPSSEALQLFTDSPQAYISYHAGFRAQVAVWPQNPIDGFISDIKTRGSISNPSQKKLWRDQKKGKKPKESSDSNIISNNDPPKNAEPLPRNRHGTCTIIDLGCGDATLAASLSPLKKPLNLKIHSLDLAKGDTPNAPLITIADITNLQAAGIKDGTVDIAICCLSLMGTNWVKVVDECARVVRGGGEFWVAEIKSRFARPGKISKGQGKKGDGIGKKKKAISKAEMEGVDEEPPDIIQVEEEGQKDVGNETDVTAFVEVVRKRGFVIKGEPDMGNKMFVRMRFVKVLRVEKAVENEKGGKARFGEGFKGKQRAVGRFVDEGGEGEVDEGKVLKPCVYKIR